MEEKQRWTTIRKQC